MDPYGPLLCLFTMLQKSCSCCLHLPCYFCYDVFTRAIYIYLRVHADVRFRLFQGFSAFPRASFLNSRFLWQAKSCKLADMEGWDDNHGWTILRGHNLIWKAWPKTRKTTCPCKCRATCSVNFWVPGCFEQGCLRSGQMQRAKSKRGGCGQDSLALFLMIPGKSDFHGKRSKWII